MLQVCKNEKVENTEICTNQQVKQQQKLKHNCCALVFKANVLFVITNNNENLHSYGEFSIKITIRGTINRPSYREFHIKITLRATINRPSYGVSDVTFALRGTINRPSRRSGKRRRGVVWR